MKSAAYDTALVLLFSASLTFAQTGKITGMVTDARTNEPLVGANVVIEGTSMGAASDFEGFFTILSVPPGSYRLRASIIGYAAATLVDVRVNIGQTTELAFRLSEAAIQAQEVVIIASQPVVQKDVSSSQLNLNFREIEHLPSVRTISNVIGLQAGIQISQTTGDLIIRGGGGDQTAFMLNGLSLRDERTNKPYLGISVTAIENVQIQTGGFNAEYGNIRSGVVNVTTKEGNRDRYSVGFLGRYSHPAPKQFGGLPNSPTSYWIRPYVDPEVCWTGTKNGAWDPFTQNQYPEFEGWIALAAKTLKDDDPSNDLTPEAAQRVFLWQHRKELGIEKPDYDIDVSFGGPVPGISQFLGDLRFFASHRRSEIMYLVPLSRDSYQDFNTQLKLTSDLGRGMKLTFEYLTGEATGTNDNNAGLAGLFTTPASIAAQLHRVSYIDARIFASDYWAPSAIKRKMYGGKLTHVLSPSQFYELSVSHFATSYSTNPGRPRDVTRKYNFGNEYYVDESPFGFQPNPSTGIDGLRMGVGMSNSRDSSEVSVITARIDYTNQLDRYNQLKAGSEFIYTDNKVNYASIDAFLPEGRSRSVWHTFPIRAAVYVQDKLEFEGMIVNLGLRLDYSDPRGKWFVYDPFNPVLDSTTEITKNFTLSPRLGVAFPVTENSKLFFNYGHFRSMPTPENLFLVRRYLVGDILTYLANPNNPLPKTVAYELGYEHSLFDEYLIRVAGYYKDVSNQATSTRYLNPSIGLSYSVSTPNSYEDIRGFEVTLSKNRGRWVQGFINYTYMVSTAGRFGYAQFSAKRSEQRAYERDNIERDLYQQRPVPRPYGRMNLDFFTPPDFGPEVAGLSLLGDWRLSLLGNYSAG
ncbi:MAG: TonB-dependent receptor, partial [Ignavibacteria bacterium]|nr:TonB-dependent receptor [Ignavibacteria bacterium]